MKDSNKYLVEYTYRIDDSWRADPPIFSLLHKNTNILELSYDEVDETIIRNKLGGSGLIIEQIKNISLIDGKCK